jgi:hypothetical protein
LRNGQQIAKVARQFALATFDQAADFHAPTKSYQPGGTMD